MAELTDAAELKSQLRPARAKGLEYARKDLRDLC